MTPSFALSDNDVVLAQPARGAAAPALTLDGGGAGRAAQAPGGEFGQQADVNARALDALDQMTQGFLRPYVEAQQKKAYFDGMSQVAQGRALQDIEREQPWFTKIFGPSATVQGAQAMTAMTQVAQAQSEFMAAMPELRSQAPDAVRQYLAEQAARLGSTGDVLVDGLIQQKLAEQWGTMLGTHMKQHMAWRQEDMGEKFIAMQAANGALLQQTLLQQAGFDDAKRAQEVEKFTAGLARPQGMTDEAYGTYMARAATAQLHGGNFAAWEAIKATPEAWQVISPKTRQELLDSEPKWRQEALKFGPALTQITTDAAQLRVAVQQGAFENEAALHAAIDGFNARFAQTSGASGPMYNNLERAALVQQYLQARADNAAAWEKARLGVLNDDAKHAATLRALNLGDPSSLPPWVSPQEVHRATEAFWREAQARPERLDTAIEKLTLSARDARLRVPSLEVQLQQDVPGLFVTGGPLTVRQQHSWGVMQKMLAHPYGPAALAHYIGADMAGKAQALLASGADPNNAEEVAAALKAIRDGAGAAVSREEVAAIESHIRREDKNWVQRFVTGNWTGGAGFMRELNMNEASRDWLAAELAPQVARTLRGSPGLSREAAVKTVFAQRLDSMDLLDGTVVLGRPNQKGPQTLIAAVRQASSSPVSQTDARYQKAVRQVLHAALEAHVHKAVDALNFEGQASIGSPHMPRKRPVDPDDYEAVGGEQLGGGNLLLTYRHKKTGQSYAVPITAGAVIEQMGWNLANPTPDKRLTKINGVGGIKSF